MSVLVVAVSVLGLVALGILTGHAALTIIAYCLLFVLLIFGAVVAYAITTRRETQHPDHRY